MNEQENTKAESRREFLGKAMLAALGTAFLAGQVEAKASEAAPKEDFEVPEGDEHLIRMQRELKEALKKPAKERRWVMVIDLRKCVGCHACTISCIAENKLPPGVVYRPVIEEEVGSYPNVSMRFLPRPCMQCDNPPCTPVCPVHATWKDEEDGIVHIDYNKCIGCRYCITACPYGARSFDFGENYSDQTPKTSEYEEAPSFDWGKKWERKNGDSPIGNARKCHFCIHRVKEGMLPACTTTCIGHATYFGDANNPKSLVAELIGKPNVMVLKEELGTHPRVYYLV
ncbi:MAG: 4Fe-4S dicluster domain-containing protein [Planctomycetota bacterium]|nr:MAG: 4Fe-4S dicluster domain-containing protein [Planctomycetota bacterium]